MGRRIVGGALLAMLALTSPAAAADRYAAPLATGPEPCAQSNPCSLADAVGGTLAANGDTVHAAAGDYEYPPAMWLQVSRSNMTVQGPASGARATVKSTNNIAVLINAPGVTLRNFDVVAHNSSGSRVLSVNPVATSFVGERLRISGTGSTSIGVQLLGGALLRDSFVTMQADGATALLGGGTGATIVNVTARAVGITTPTSGVALYGSSDFMSDGQAQQLTVVNSILQGGQHDIKVEGASLRHVRADVDHSNWQTASIWPVESELVEGAGNQKTAEPVFEFDGVRQAAASPTINAGRTLAQLGAADLFGTARPSGSAPDIGAHEVHEAPPVTIDDTSDESATKSATTPTTSTTPTVTSTPAADVTAPAFGALGLSKRRFAVGRAPRGTTFRWTLSEPATVTITLERRLAGLRVRRSGRLRCLRATAQLRRSLRGKPQRRCTLFRGAGTLRRNAATGAATLAFSGRVGAKLLPPGAYRATVTATDAADNRSAARRLTFTIVRR